MPLGILGTRGGELAAVLSLSLAPMVGLSQLGVELLVRRCSTLERGGAVSSCELWGGATVRLGRCWRWTASDQLPGWL